jgi:molybdate transport system substrate-binding protein
MLHENLKIMSDGPLQPGLADIGKAFHRESGRYVEFVFGTSPVIHHKAASGEKADVLIIQPNFIADLLRLNRVVPGHYPALARTGLGLMARSDAPPFDVSTVASFKKTILDAESVAFNDVASGNYFADLLKRLGIAKTVERKIVRVESTLVFERIREGKSEIGVATIPLINAAKGLRLIGPLPDELQSYIHYAAALMTSATSPQAGLDFISFLRAPAAKLAFAKTGVEIMSLPHRSTAESDR